MKTQIINWMKRGLSPLRNALAQLFSSDTDSLFYKAARLMVSAKIEGDYLEFGVFSGGTFVSAYQSIQTAFKESFKPSIWSTEEDRKQTYRMWKKIRFFAFDSFQGLPEPQGIDTLSKDFAPGKFANTEKNFTTFIKSRGVDLKRVEVIPGWFDESLNSATIGAHKMKRAAIVHIDSDLYESAKLVLAFIKPLLVEGTILIFDDWYNFRGNPNLGEQRAFHEWLQENPDWGANPFQKEGIWRNSFILYKRDSHPDSTHRD